MAIAPETDRLPTDAHRVPKTSELVARTLVAYIIDNDLAEGTKLPNERDMIAWLRVGRTTLREGLRLLETRGVLTVRSGRDGGPIVRRPKPSDLGDSLRLILQFESASLSDVLEARAAIEPTLARLAAGRIDAAHLVALRETIDTMRDQETDQFGFSCDNLRFHQTIADAAQSVVLRSFVDSMSAIADGTLIGVWYSPRRRRAVARAHEQILQALEQGDGARAEQAMSAHLVEAGKFWASEYSAMYSSPVRWA